MRLVAERRALGMSAAQVGRELEVRPDQLRAWAREQARDARLGSRVAGESPEQELRRLRREVAVLRQEQAFAKKVAVDSTGQRNSASKRVSGVSNFSVFRGRALSLAAT